MSQRFVLLGHPVAHSLSPVIHRAAYQELGAQAEYSLIDAPTPEDVRRVVSELRSGAISGINITVPWKREAIACADVVAESAQNVSASNVLFRRQDGRIVAENTDVLALTEELGSSLSEHSVLRRGVLVLGTGGAALAAVAAARRLGLGPIWVTGRKFDQQLGHETWEHADDFRRLGASLLPFPEVKADFLRVSDQLGIIIQATSLGMTGKDPGAALFDRIPFGQFPRLVAYDVVYTPRETYFLSLARAAGHPGQHGLGMLVRQAACAIEIWLGRRPALGPMFAAADRALTEREEKAGRPQLGGQSG